jgi:hypothetical protein
MFMRKRLTSLVLLLGLSGSAFAGIPLNFGERECSMGQAMDGMDCCKAALMGGESLKTTAARLCCVVNGSHDGSTPPSGVRVSPPSQPVVSDYQRGTPGLPASVLLTRQISRSHGPPADSNPAYIRHLALLI